MYLLSILFAILLTSIILVITFKQLFSYIPLKTDSIKSTKHAPPTVLILATVTELVHHRVILQHTVAENYNLNKIVKGTSVSYFK
jgi:hypothetical protein